MRRAARALLPGGDARQLWFVQPRGTVGDLRRDRPCGGGAEGRTPASFPSAARVDSCSTLFIDPATRANLELLRTLSGSRTGPLFAAIDRTATGAGARLLADRLTAPLTDPARIAKRLDSVSFFRLEGACAGIRAGGAEGHARHDAGANTAGAQPWRPARPSARSQADCRRRRRWRRRWPRANCRRR